MADEKKVAETEKKETVKTERKKSKKDIELESLKLELEKNKDLLLRTAAEFDNYKKRTEREKQGVAEFTRASMLKELLPILDNIARSSAVEKDTPEYVKGIEMIVKQFEGLYEKFGIVSLANVGDEFNPNLHEAVMHIDDEAFAENVIVEILQQGYKVGETVIRPAMVKVAN